MLFYANALMMLMETLGPFTNVRKLLMGFHMENWTLDYNMFFWQLFTHGDCFKEAKLEGTRSLRADSVVSYSDHDYIHLISTSRKL